MQCRRRYKTSGVVTSALGSVQNTVNQVMQAVSSQKNTSRSGTISPRTRAHPRASDLRGQ